MSSQSESRDQIESSEQDHNEDDRMDNDDDESSSSMVNAIRRPVINNVSLVEYYGPSASSCGYCGRADLQSSEGRRSYDMHAYSLTAADYQGLIDRGWRRSGTYCYCPINQSTCCPNYSILCKANEFRLTRSHRKCIEKVLSYLSSDNVKTGLVDLDYSRGDLTNVKSRTTKKAKSIDELKSSRKLRDKRYLKSIDRKVSMSKMSPGEVAESIRKKWEERMEPSLPLESYLFPRPSMLSNGESKESFQPRHKLEIDMIYVDSKQCQKIRGEQHEMMIKYQAKVHKETQREWTMTRFSDFLVDSPIITKPLTDFDYLTDRESNAKYNSDTLSVDVDHSEDYLILRPPQLPSSYGTYHCNYHLDGKLIATGVLDVLEKCITTVYFFYDPDYAFLNLGIFSALVEISMIRRMSRHYIGPSENQQLVNYYLGFYVHECKKMHYKTRFEPSFLLCSKTFRYVPTRVCLQKLKDQKYADFDETVLPDDDENAKETSMEKFIRFVRIPIESPFDSSDAEVANYLDWLEAALGREYVDLFLNGYLMTYDRLVGPTLSLRLKLKVNVVHRTLVGRHKHLTRLREATRDESSDSGDAKTTSSSE